jgi:hypothetical protein
VGYPCITGPPATATRYLAELLRAKPFVRYEEGPVRLLVYRGSEAERDRVVLLQRRVAALARIERFFGRKAPWPVSVFLYPSWTAAGRYPIGTAMPSSFACFGAYTAGSWAFERHHDGHELTHLFSSTDAAHQLVFVVGVEARPRPRASLITGRRRSARETSRTRVAAH